MAREAGIEFSPAQFSGVLEAEIDEFSLKNFADLVRADEREAGAGAMRHRHPLQQGEHMNIPLELQDRLIEVLRLAHDNALEAYQDAQVRYKGYKQLRIDALRAEAVETEAVLFEVLKARGNT
jgi:hypothetical protein